jgi:hypothetical protein
MSIIRLNIHLSGRGLRRLVSAAAKADYLPEANGDLQVRRAFPRDDSKMDMLAPDLAFERIRPDDHLTPCDGTAEMGSVAGTMSMIGAGYKMEDVASNRPVCRVMDDAGRATQLLFVYLQVLDFITTVLGFRLGGSEASPFVCLLMHAGPVTGVLISKILALALGGACLYLKKTHLLRFANYWYAGLILWNLFVIFARLGGIRG